MDSKKLTVLIRELAENKKAENITTLDLRKLSSVADYFVIATGTSEPHLRALVGEITERLNEDHGLRPLAVDGQLPTSWVVLDFHDVIVHIMKQDVRDKYDLEGLWSDAPRVKPRRSRAAAKAS